MAELVGVAAHSAAGLRRNATADEVIDAEASNRTAMVVSMVLISTLLANAVQRMQTSSWQCPESILAIVIGFIASLPLCSAAVRPGKDFDTIFFLYLVPPILFESVYRQPSRAVAARLFSMSVARIALSPSSRADQGYSLNQKDFFRNFTAIVLFAVVGTVISSLVAGVALFSLAQRGWISGLNAESPKEALQFGTLLSATDTVATIAVLRQMGVDPQLYALIFGESVLNDAVAVVLFQTLASLSDDEAAFHVSNSTVSSALSRFVGVFVGSVAMGVLFGLLTALITKRCLKNAHAHSEVMIMLGMAYLAFILADDLSLSGLMSVFFAGVVMSHYAKYNLSLHGQHTTQHVSRTLSHLGELLTFMYFGFTILPVINSRCESADGPEHLYEVSWTFVFWTLVMCVVSRGAAVVPLTGLVNVFKARQRQRVNRISLRSMLMMWFCILRGAVAFALSLTISSINRRFMIPCIVMVILFTNLVLGQATVPVLRLLKIPIGVIADEDDLASPQSRRIQTDGPNAEVGPPPLGSQVGKLHRMWRRVDEIYIKPLFGGRKRGVYRVQRGYDEGPEGRNAPMLAQQGESEYEEFTNVAEVAATTGGLESGSRDGGRRRLGDGERRPRPLQARRQDLELRDMGRRGLDSPKSDSPQPSRENNAGNVGVGVLEERRADGEFIRQKSDGFQGQGISRRFQQWFAGHREGDGTGPQNTANLSLYDSDIGQVGWGQSAKAHGGTTPSAAAEGDVSAGAGDETRQAGGRGDHAESEQASSEPL